MVYMLGGSHIGPVLDACSAENGQSIYSEQEPAFIDWRTKPGTFAVPVKAANIYVGQYSPHWGPTLAVQTEPTVIRIAPGFQSLLASIDRGDAGNVVFVFMKGEEYYHMAGADSVPHDFYLPWHPELGISPQLQVVPLEIVQREVAYYLTDAIAAFNAIYSLLPGTRIVNVICPPPTDLESYAKVIYDPSKLPGQALKYSVRLKYYLLYRKMLQEAVALRGIESLLPPAETVRPDGPLRPEFVGDGFHGNLLYGSHVCAQMNELLTTGAR